MPKKLKMKMKMKNENVIRGSLVSAAAYVLPLRARDSVNF